MFFWFNAAYAGVSNDYTSRLRKGLPRTVRRLFDEWTVAEWSRGRRAANAMPLAAFVRPGHRG